MNLYQEEILAHYRAPHHKGRLENPTYSVYAKNLSCGDELGLDVIVQDRIIKELGFWGNGCAISQAAMSLLSDHLIGSSVDSLKDWDENDILDLLGVPLGPNRRKCGLLSLDLVQKLSSKIEINEYV